MRASDRTSPHVDDHAQVFVQALLVLIATQEHHLTAGQQDSDVVFLVVGFDSCDGAGVDEAAATKIENGWPVLDRFCHGPTNSLGVALFPRCTVLAAWMAVGDVVESEPAGRGRLRPCRRPS